MPSENPKSLWTLVEKWESDRATFPPTDIGIAVDCAVKLCKQELAELLREWHKAIDKGIKNLPPAQIGPLHDMGMIDEARSTQKLILGVPFEESRDDK